MKCIVQSLLDESANELTDELMKSEGLQLDANLEVGRRRETAHL